MSALPPVVVSGLPNMTPIFIRIWLMKMTSVLVRLMLPVSLRSAWLMRRACRPGSWSPISPPERTSMSAISRPCSPVSGWLMSMSGTFTPNLAA